jgi:hypothetical protein
MAESIFLKDVYQLREPEQYKLHLARWNGADQPLNVFVRDRDAWERWNRWRGQKNEFNREFIFALIDFYPQRDRWLFGGAYRVIGRQDEARAHSYEVELLEESRPFVGRLKVVLRSPGRSRAFRLENHYRNMIVDELLAAPYTGEPFAGYDQICLTFSELESIISTQRQDWKAALSNAKGIYLISDRSNGKLYVGSACRNEGLWDRWACYVATAHGHNKELTAVIGAKGTEHARNFGFALLEHFTPSTDDDTVLEREQHWKRVLLSRGDYGYNRN